MTLIDKAEAHDMQTITEQAAKDARDVFESYGSKSREAIDYMEQLIYAALRKTEPALPARGVGVKPLVWFEAELPSRGGGKFTSEGYTIRRIEGLWLLDFAGNGKSKWRWVDLDAAKAAAQADYDARILAALEPVTQPITLQRIGTGLYETQSDYRLAPHLQSIVEAAKTAPQWDTVNDRMSPLPDTPDPSAHVNEAPKSEHDGADVLTAAQAPAEDAHVKGETDGQMLERLGMDGAKWAAEFRTTALRLGYSDMDEGWLIGWFCNAIMAGYDRAAAQAREAAQEHRLIAAAKEARDIAIRHAARSPCPYGATGGDCCGGYCSMDDDQKGGDAFEDRDSDRPNPATSPGVTAGADAAQAREAAQEHRLIAAAKEARDIAIRHAAREGRE